MDGTAVNITDKIDRFFKISERGSSIKTEILAGATTFMTMIRPSWQEQAWIKGPWQP